MGILDQYGLRQDQISAALGRLKQNPVNDEASADEFEGLVLGRDDLTESAAELAPKKRNLGRAELATIGSRLRNVGDHTEIEIGGDAESKTESKTESKIEGETASKVEGEELPPGWRAVELVSWNLQLLRAMDWKLFEEVCAEMFRREGYAVELASSGSDEGIDMVLRPDGEDGSGGGIAVRCKHYQALDIELKQVSEFRDAVGRTAHEEMIFVTTGNFNQRALVDYGSEDDISMVNGDALLDRIQDLGSEAGDMLLQRVLTDEGGWQTPSCPACDVKMVWRSPKPGRRQFKAFWGCPNYGMAGAGRCRRTFNQA